MGISVFNKGEFLVSIETSSYSLLQVFLVMPFMHGGELFHHINNQGLFLEEEAAFYIAEVTLALEHLHLMGVIHRDLKPENVLMAKDGHICLTDFGLAKDTRLTGGANTSPTNRSTPTSTEQKGKTKAYVPPGARARQKQEQGELDKTSGSEDRNPHTSSSTSSTRTSRSSQNESSEEEPRSHTLCGTDYYMAPEMIAKRGYGPAVDWWATGALLFEMLTGDVPFKSSNTRVLHRKILTEKVIVPNWLSNSTHALVKGLLERNVERRLGSGKSTMFKVPTAPR